MSEPDPYQTKPPQSAEREPPLSGDAPALDQQQSIGRYRVERVLGEGGFGRVYLAHDDQLNRPVAIKVPHRHLVSEARDAAAYLAEARVLARLDHPNIVPVYDVGSTGDGLCYVVSKFIEGSDLAKKIQEARPSAAGSAGLLAAVALALHYAHRQGLVHRDVKPGNILIDTSGKPYVADFGLALREEDFGTGPSFAGTPAYMSPEQARREGHRVDARSDIFSLGVVFYELLTGVLPFGGNNLFEVLKEIKTLEPCPPRQLDDAIPEELERICLKALAKRAMERYTAAKEVADDLRYFLDRAREQEKSVLRPAVRPSPVLPQPAATPTPSDTPDSDQRPIKIVPKGLRAFDAGDADFFLELLPGPRDRNGLPDSIRFWQRRIEATDPDQTFSVGLLYGPSGCGKSSLVKAGLLPWLADHVLAIYVESTADETEARLLKGLRKRCRDLPDQLGLVEALASLRRGKVLPSGKKVLLVLDQFEQWLHAKRQEQNTELVQALRQCDGEHVQCLVLVRDDFWLAVSRFIRDLEVRLVEGHNTALVDLFDPLHARKVLAAFGRAFGRLTDPPAPLIPDQERFLDQTIAGLTRDGKIISVRLSLFAEMVKGKPWTPATLKEVGGTEGIGARFLEETFSAATAPPEHRLHQKAAQAVLRALLPGQGTKIKGHMRSRHELLEASGYARRPRDFEDLLRILDTELRLVTPTDPEEVASAPGERGEPAPRSPEPLALPSPADGGGDGRVTVVDAGRAAPSPSPLPPPGGEGRLRAEGAQYYQLTHDYLVPALRQWLTRKQQETRRGRMELRLADWAALWNARPERRHLPGWWEGANIRLLTRRRDWTPAQRQMMRAATRHQALQAGVLLLLLALAGWGSYEGHGYVRAHSLAEKLASAEIQDVPPIITEMTPYRRWADGLLARMAEQPRNDKEWLHATLALLPVDPQQADPLEKRLLNAQLPDLPVLREALRERPYVTRRLWKVLEDPRGEREQRFRAGLALAVYDPPGSEETRQRWQQEADFLSRQLVAAALANPTHYTVLLESLRPVRSTLLERLGDLFRRTSRPDSERLLAANLLADYAANQPDVLAALATDAEPEQYAIIWPKLQQYPMEAVRLMNQELDLRAEQPAANDKKDVLAKQQAQAAVTLLRLGRAERIWPLLQHSDEPQLRSFLIHRFGPLGADPQALIDRLDQEPEVSIRRALILSLGEYPADNLKPELQQSLAAKLLKWYRDDPDPGIHSAAEWLLRKCKHDPQVQKTDEEPVSTLDLGDRRWYVTKEGHTMVIVPGPVTFLMGSPAPPDRANNETHHVGSPDTVDRASDEPQHWRRIDRSFAIATRPVTVQQFRKFWQNDNSVPHRYETQPAYRPFRRDLDAPMFAVSWYEAAAYCNWLSEQEELPEEEWCYLPVGYLAPAPRGASAVALGASPLGIGSLSAVGTLITRKHGLFASGMQCARNYLKRIGYRLPREAEWEYACRATATTSRFYGTSEELLKYYAWYRDNSDDRPCRVGQLKPNDFGLFDVYGNVWQWCQDAEGTYPREPGDRVFEDEEEQTLLDDKDQRMYRGGSFQSRPRDVNSANRTRTVPWEYDIARGFRVARTCH